MWREDWFYRVKEHFWVKSASVFFFKRRVVSGYTRQIAPSVLSCRCILGGSLMVFSSALNWYIFRFLSALADTHRFHILHWQVYCHALRRRGGCNGQLKFQLKLASSITAPPMCWCQHQDNDHFVLLLKKKVESICLLVCLKEPFETRHHCS